MSDPVNPAGSSAPTGSADSYAVALASAIGSLCALKASGKSSFNREHTVEDEIMEMCKRLRELNAARSATGGTKGQHE